MHSVAAGASSSSPAHLDQEAMKSLYLPFNAGRESSAALPSAFTGSGSTVSSVDVQSWLLDPQPTRMFDGEPSDTLTSAARTEDDFGGSGKLRGTAERFLVGVLFCADPGAGSVTNADTLLFSGESASVPVNVPLFAPPGLALVSGTDFPLPGNRPQPEIYEEIDSLLSRDGTRNAPTHQAVALVPETASVAALGIAFIGSLWTCHRRRSAAVVS